ncbi:hypothetical protein IQ07DRAFT_592803 [Pyrenochaeta sp. DS3sAY3a]|nr:hypothetical protein IQ07DRAFT_592803 [Pyrenochaeta sp. DS3sAY3a]
MATEEAEVKRNRMKENLKTLKKEALNLYPIEDEIKDMEASVDRQISRNNELLKRIRKSHTPSPLLRKTVEAYQQVVDMKVVGTLRVWGEGAFSFNSLSH